MVEVKSRLYTENDTPSLINFVVAVTRFQLIPQKQMFEHDNWKYFKILVSNIQV